MEERTGMPGVEIVPATSYEAFAAWEENTFGTGKPYHRDISRTFDEICRLDDQMLDKMQGEKGTDRKKYAIRHFLFYRLTEIEGERLSQDQYDLMRMLTRNRTLSATVGWNVYSMAEQALGMKGDWHKGGDVEERTIKRKIPLLLEQKRLKKIARERPDEVRREIQKNLLASAGGHIVSARNLVAAWAKDVLEEAKGKPNLQDTVVCQILRQLRSVALHKEVMDNPQDYDWFAQVGEEDLLHYLTDLLAELYLTVLTWDGLAALPPRIMAPKNRETTLVAVSMIAPFTRIFLSPVFLDGGSEVSVFQPDGSSQYTLTKAYATDEMRALLMAGLVYADFHSWKQQQYPLQMMPVRLWLTEPQAVWKDVGCDQIPVTTLRQLCQKLNLAYREHPFLHLKDVSILEELMALLDHICGVRIALLREMDLIHKRLVGLPRRNQTLDGVAEQKRKALEAREKTVQTKHTKINSTVELLVGVLTCCCAEFLLPVLNQRRLENETVKNGRKAHDILIRLLGVSSTRVNESLLQVHNVTAEKILVQWQKKLCKFAANTLDFRFTYGKDYDFWRVQAKHNLEHMQRGELGVPAEAVREAVKSYIKILLLPVDEDVELTEVTHPQLLFDHILPTQRLIRDAGGFFPEEQKKIKAAKEYLEGFAPCGGCAPDDERQLSTWAVDRIVSTAPQIWMPTEFENGLRKQYFLGDLDGVAVSVYGDDPTEPEVRLMAHLLAGNDVVLSLPQLVDSRLIRNLAFQKDFQVLLRSGRISLSSYAGNFSLAEHCAAQMGKNFHWSSLEPDPGSGQPDYFEDRAMRAKAADYLRGICQERELPEEIRDAMVMQKAAIRCLDENLPFQTRAYFHQRPAGSGISYSQELQKTFEYLRKQNNTDLNKACRIHKRIHDALCKRTNLPKPSEYYRSDYYGIIKLLSDTSGLERLDPAWRGTVTQCIEAIGTPSPEALRKTKVVCDNVYLQTTGIRFAPIVSLPSLDEDIWLVRPESRNLEYRDNSVLREAARGLHWEDVVEFNSLMQQNPGFRPEDLIRELNDSRCVFDLVGSGPTERVLAEKVELTTNSGKHLKIELASAGISHIETLG